MIERLRQLRSRRSHLRTRMLWPYLDGELAHRQRIALEAHLRDCRGCRELLESLQGTARALRTLRADARPGLVESVIDAVRASAAHDGLRPSATPPRLPALKLVPDAARDATEPAAVEPQGRGSGIRLARTLVGYGVRRAQLRITLPLTLAVGIALSLSSQGSMIFDARASVIEVCVACAPNFVIPFIALNLGLLAATRMSRRRGR
jgi:anti-sigma factor RsiW